MLCRFRAINFFLHIACYLIVSVATGQITTFSLNGYWKFRQAGTSKWMPAKVPGTVHTDLIANGIISDPYYRTNEKDLQWIGEKDWEYTTTFAVGQTLLRQDNLELVFQGLDTYADIYLNNTLFLSADNMHREWRKSCKSLLHEGQNKITVRFHSVFKTDVPKYLSAAYKLQAWPNNDQGDMWLSLYARKAGYEYGWDWGPRLITSGIWRPVLLEGWSGARINNIQVIQEEITRKKASLKAVYQIQSDKQQDVVVSVFHEGKRMASKKVYLIKGLNKVALQFDVLNPRLWWSNGLGEAHLYTFSYVLQHTTSILDRKEIRTGIRDLKVVRQDDQYGKSFYVRLNGLPLFIKGANYIPNDNFLTRVSDEKYTSIISAAKEANMNMLRVWGGGIYEQDIFYDLCDQNGILVWQDMMFACGMFPNNSDFVENVKQEVIQNVTRLRNHPSIALWCGNNENEISWYGWGWKNKYPEAVQRSYETSMHQLFHAEIPNAIYTVDSTRYYHPSSPNTGYNNIPGKMGDAHYYGVWSAGAPFEAYDQNIARFMSEYGFQSFPEYKSVLQFTEPGDRVITSPVMLSHQRAKDNDSREDFGNKTIRRYMDMYYREPKDFESFLYLSQVLQAKGMFAAIESHRRNMPYCMGTMYWQLNDCWPVASWSGIDYYGRWKALHYVVKNAYRKELISAVVEAGKISVHIASDRLKTHKVRLTLKLMDFDGNTLSVENKDVDLQPYTSRVYFQADTSALIKGHNLKNVVYVIQVDDRSQTLASKYFYFLPEKELELRPVTIEASVNKNGQHNTLKLKASKLAKSVFISLKIGDALFSDNYFDLLPGEEKVIEMKSYKKAIEENNLNIMSLVDTYGGAQIISGNR